MLKNLFKKMKKQKKGDCAEKDIMDLNNRLLSENQKMLDNWIKTISK